MTKSSFCYKWSTCCFSSKAWQLSGLLFTPSTSSSSVETDDDLDGHRPLLPAQALCYTIGWPFCWKETLIKDLKNDDRKSGRPPFVFAWQKMMMEYLMKWHLWVLSRAQGYEKTAPQKWMHIAMKKSFPLVFKKKISSNVVICRFLIQPKKIVEFCWKHFNKIVNSLKK